MPLVRSRVTVHCPTGVGARYSAPVQGQVDIPSSEIDVFLIGTLVSGAVGALAIGFLLEYIRRAGFGIFALYRLALAVVVALVYLLR